MEKLIEKDIPSAYLSPVSDVDEATDLAHAVSCIRAIARAAKSQPDLYVPQRVLDWVDFLGLKIVTPPNEDRDPRSDIDR